MTVQDLKKKLKNVPNDLKVVLSSDSGVNQCDDPNFEPVIETAYATNNEFMIYANYREISGGNDYE